MGERGGREGRERGEGERGEGDRMNTHDRWYSSSYSPGTLLTTKGSGKPSSANSWNWAESPNVYSLSPGGVNPLNLLVQVRGLF